MRYRYCPVCGRELVEKVAGDDGLVPYCDTCGRYWFDTFNDCVIIMLVNENREVAMLKQSYMSDEYMNFISGYITVGENAEAAARREVLEEVGIMMDSMEYAGTWWYGEEDLLMHGFIGHTHEHQFNLSVEVDEAKWIPIEELTDYMYPDSPGNAQYGTYTVYMHKHAKA